MSRLYILNLLLFPADRTFTRARPCRPAEDLADVSEAARLIHHDPAARIVPAELRFSDAVAVAFEAVVGGGKLFFAQIAFVPLDVVYERDDREARMQSGDGVSQPFGECVRSDAVVDGA